MTAKPLAGAALAGVAALVLAGCGGSGSSKKSASGGRTVDVTLTDAGCNPAKLSLPAGPTTFEVTNDGADAVSEFEILDGTHIVGEVENIAPGLSGHFSLTLEPGRYTLYCPGGKTERGPLVVSGAAAGTSTAAADAVTRYRRYLEAQTTTLVLRTKALSTALSSGDVAAARKAYETARIPYEQIEPVAESFGGLDPAIDARAGDVPAAKWTGFHPIEKTLWVGGTTAGTGALATKLNRDVLDLQRRVRTIRLQPAQIANGAVELLGEVSKSKITGEEERYSRIDLVDFDANVDGAREAFVAVRPIVAARNAALAGRIDRQFAAVDAALEPYRRGASYVPYTALTEDDTRALSRAIDALAEPLSQVGALAAQA